MWIFRLLLIAVFLSIYRQDYKDRLVYWFLYLLVGILAFTVQLQYNNFYTALSHLVINLGLVLMMLVTCWGYSGLVLKMKFINGTFGSGDVQMLLFLCFTFSSVSFLVLLVFSLIFSFFLHLFMKNRTTHPTVPLAGYMSIFFAAIYLAAFFFEPKYLYAY